MKTKQITIPVFIPMQACPFHCIYCDQQKITGRTALPDEASLMKRISGYLKTKRQDNRVELGFFGGTFTGLPLAEQERLLRIAEPFVRAGEIQSLRLSTRPDFIDPENLDLLKRYHVSTIELGAQSMDAEVLKKSGRGHSPQQSVEAAEMIRAAGFRLGLQMMIGLPGDDTEKSLATARHFVSMDADDVRIYPAIVIRGTGLETLYNKGKYSPLSLEAAAETTAALLEVFLPAGINVIRIGLHPSEGLLDGSDLVAGPFHVAFGEMAMTALWKHSLEKINIPPQAKKISVAVASGQLNSAVGHKATNKKMLSANGREVKFQIDESLKNQEYHVYFD